MTTRKETGIPFSSGDLRYIADQIDEVLNDLKVFEDLPEDDWRWGISVKIRDEMAWDLGEIRPHVDGWLGFYPEGW